MGGKTYSVYNTHLQAGGRQGRKRRDYELSLIQSHMASKFLKHQDDENFLGVTLLGDLNTRMNHVECVEDLSDLAMDELLGVGPKFPKTQALLKYLGSGSEINFVPENFENVLSIWPLYPIHEEGTAVENQNWLQKIPIGIDGTPVTDLDKAEGFEYQVHSLVDGELHVTPIEESALSEDLRDRIAKPIAKVKPVIHPLKFHIEKAKKGVFLGTGKNKHRSKARLKEIEKDHHSEKAPSEATNGKLIDINAVRPHRFFDTTHRTKIVLAVHGKNGAIADHDGVEGTTTFSK